MISILKSLALNVKIIQVIYFFLCVSLQPSFSTIFFHNDHLPLEYFQFFFQFKLKWLTILNYFYYCIQSSNRMSHADLFSANLSGELFKK